MANWTLLFVVSLLLKFYSVCGVELTFELDDNAKDCFYEVIEKDTSVTLEYQVSLHVKVFIRRIRISTCRKL